MRLADIGDYVGGVTFKPEDLIDPSDDDAVVCMRTKNVQEDLDTEDVIAIPSRLVRRPDQYLVDGDIVISSANSWNLVGKCCYVTNLPFRAAIGGFISLFRPDQRLVDPRYLYRWMSSESTQRTVRSCARQTTNIANLSRERFLDIVVPLPPHTEQRRIAAILDKADDIRRKRQRAIALTEELLRSTFLEMFGDPVSNPKGWPVRMLGDVVDLYAGNSLPAGVPFSGQEGGYLLLKVGDMNAPGNETEIHAARGWTDVVSRAAIVAPAGAVVIPKRGGAIATNKKRLLKRPAVLDPNLMAIAPRPSLVLAYLRQWFTGVNLATMSNGTAVPQLNKKDLAPLVLPIPPVADQEKFSLVAERIRTMSVRAEAALAGSNALSQSLGQRAFSGDL